MQLCNLIYACTQLKRLDCLELQYRDYEMYTLSVCHAVMYQSNRSFNTPPPGQPPWHLNFWKIFVQIPPSPGQKGKQMSPPPPENIPDYLIIRYKKSQVSLAHE